MLHVKMNNIKKILVLKQVQGIVSLETEYNYSTFKNLKNPLSEVEQSNNYKGT